MSDTTVHRTLDDVRVRDCMHAGIVSCSPDSSCSDVARMMGDHRVHAVAVADIGHGRPWGTWHIVTDKDVVLAVASGQERKAHELAGTDVATISAGERLERAAQLMIERGVSHLVVVHEAGGYPVGILSTLDVAAAYGSAKSSMDQG
jgi:CBS domain-containing protein